MARSHEDTKQRVEKILDKLRPSLSVIIQNNVVGQWLAEVNVSNGGTSRVIIQIREAVD